MVSHIAERNNRGDLHIKAGAVYMFGIICNNIHPVEEHGFDRGLPWP